MSNQFICTDTKIEPDVFYFEAAIAVFVQCFHENNIYPHVPIKTLPFYSVSHHYVLTWWHLKADPLTQRECTERFTETHTHGHTQCHSTGIGSMSSSSHKGWRHFDSLLRCVLWCERLSCPHRPLACEQRTLRRCSSFPHQCRLSELSPYAVTTRVHVGAIKSRMS